MRAVLRLWATDCSHKISRQAKLRTAVIHAMMSLAAFVWATWRSLVSAARHDRDTLERGARLWAGATKVRVWNTWLSYAEERAHYMRLAARIASGSASAVQSLVWSAWRRHHVSTCLLRESLLAEHRLKRKRRALHALRGACVTQRTRMTALRHLAGCSAARVLQMHHAAWRSLVSSRKALDTKYRLHLGRLVHASLAGGLLTWLAHVGEIARAKATMQLCMASFLHREAGKAFRQWQAIAEAANEVKSLQPQISHVQFMPLPFLSCTLIVLLAFGLSSVPSVPCRHVKRCAWHSTVWRTQRLSRRSVCGQSVRRMQRADSACCAQQGCACEIGCFLLCTMAGRGTVERHQFDHLTFPTAPMLLSCYFAHTGTLIAKSTSLACCIAASSALPTSCQSSCLAHGSNTWMPSASAGRSLRASRGSTSSAYSPMGWHNGFGALRQKLSVRRNCVRRLAS